MLTRRAVASLGCMCERVKVRRRRGRREKSEYLDLGVKFSLFLAGEYLDVGGDLLPSPRFPGPDLDVASDQLISPWTELCFVIADQSCVPDLNACHCFQSTKLTGRLRVRVTPLPPQNHAVFRLESSWRCKEESCEKGRTRERGRED